MLNVRPLHETLITVCKPTNFRVLLIFTILCLFKFTKFADFKISMYVCIC